MSPVDFATSTSADGSASIWVGNTDRVYGMRGGCSSPCSRDARCSTRTSPSTTRATCAIASTGGATPPCRSGTTRASIYPTRFMASHGFTRIDPWPVDRRGPGPERDPQPDGWAGVAVHLRQPRAVHGRLSPAHRSGRGPRGLAGRPADAKGLVVGRATRDGLDWRDALSDDDSAYVELQAGLFRNQETYAFLEPQESIRFTEYWLPVRGHRSLHPGDHGRRRACRAHAGRALDIALNVTRELRGGTAADIRGHAERGRRGPRSRTRRDFHQVVRPPDRFESGPRLS